MNLLVGVILVVAYINNIFNIFIIFKEQRKPLFFKGLQAFIRTFITNC